MNTQLATFAAGCFWTPEEIFRTTLGVIDTDVGFMGGNYANPSYEKVCTGITGHAEVTQVTYDPQKISYEELLKIFWDMHDPTQVNRQGPDHGAQYRSAIFYHTDAQKKDAEASKAERTASGTYDKPIATEIVPAGPFYKAEEYHQEYVRKHGGNAACHI